MPPDADAERSKFAIATIYAATFLAVVVLFIAGALLQQLNLPFGLVATSLIVFAAAGLALPAAFNVRALEFVGAHRLQGGVVALAFVAGVANLGFGNFLMGAVHSVAPASWRSIADQMTVILTMADPTTRLLISLGAAVAAPIGEELFFRGWLQPLLERRFGRVAAIVSTALLFSLVHLEPVGFIARFELGLLFGLLRSWSGSIYPAMAAHAAHNLTSVAIMYLVEDPMKELHEPFRWGEAAAFGFGSLLATLGVLAALSRLAPRARMDALEPITPILAGSPPLRARTGLLIAWFFGTIFALVVTGIALGLAGRSLPGFDLASKLPMR